MMKDFKEWSDAIKYLQSQSNWSAAVHNKMSGCRVFLDSLATLADEPPCKWKPDDTIRPEYADYYQAKCAVLLAEKAASDKQYQDACDDAHRFAVELATAQQRIAELKAANDIWKRRSQEEQPKPVMLNKTQFDKLMFTISEAHRMGIEDWNNNHIELQKLLCGE